MKKLFLLLTFICIASNIYSQTAEEWLQLVDDTKDLNQKIIYYTKAIEIDPQDATAYVNRGNAKSQLGQYEPAIEDFSKAIQIYPQFALAYHKRGDAKYDLGQYELAIEDYSKALQIDPQYAATYVNRGAAKYELGHYEPAIEDYNKALQIDPQYAAAYHNRGSAKASLSQYKAAIEDYNKALQIDPQIAAAYHNRGSAKKDLGQYEPAIEDYSKALQIDPQYASAYLGRGNSKYDLGQYKAAIEDYNKALQIDPQYALVQNQLEKTKKLLAGTGTRFTAREPKVWALAVGINSYQYDFILSDLDFSQQHAYEFARLLERYGFTDNRVIPVLSSNRGQKSTIINFLNNEFCNDQVQQDDLIIFFFSGHGLTADGKVGLCPQDYIDASQLITDQDILDILNKSPAKHKICFIESCKTEAKNMAPLSPGELEKFHTQRNTIGSGVVFITSTEPGKESYQVPPEGGYFSYFLLKGLEGEADRNKDQTIQTKELFDYIKENVSEKTNNHQIPQINKEGYDLDVPIFVIN